MRFIAPIALASAVLCLSSVAGAEGKDSKKKTTPPKTTQVTEKLTQPKPTSPLVKPAAEAMPKVLVQDPRPPATPAAQEVVPGKATVGVTPAAVPAPPVLKNGLNPAQVTRPAATPTTAAGATDEVAKEREHKMDTHTK